MKKILYLFLCCISGSLLAQKTNVPVAVEADPQGVQVVKTNHSIQIGGKTIAYTAITGYMHMKADWPKYFLPIIKKTGRMRESGR